jgi:hypothetical protein
MTMSKTIFTLIDDIKAVMHGSHTISEEAVAQFGGRLASTIASRLLSGERPVSSDLRMSNLGTPCERKLWYSVSEDHVGEELPAEAKLKFLFGDILEEMLLFLAEAAGHEVRGRQDELEIEGVKGHRDAIIDGVLVDVKSASSYSFNKFARHELEGDDPFGYIDQLNAYHYATVRTDPSVDKDQFAFLVIDKQLGKLCLDIHNPNGKNYADVVRAKRAIVDAPTPPQRSYNDEPDGSSGNRKLSTVCSYCDYKSTCWPGLRAFAYSTGPRYLTRVEKQPIPPEVPVV